MSKPVLAALAKAESEEKPDVMGFVGEYGKIKREFDAGVTAILTPDQVKQWGSFKAQLETELSETSAQKQLAALKTPLALTDGGKIGLRDKLKAKNGMEAVNKTLDKSMAEVMSPDRVANDKAAMEKKKAAGKG